MKHKKKIITAAVVAVVAAAAVKYAGVRLAIAMIFLALPQEIFKSIVALF